MSPYKMIRKTHLPMMSPLFLTLLAISCNEQNLVEEPTPTVSQDSIPVTFRFGGMLGEAQQSQTRTTWDTNEFPNGSLVGIFVYDQEGNEVYSNREYKYSTSTGTFSPNSTAQTIYTGSGKNFSYYVYSPYKSTARADSIHSSWTYSQSYSSNLKTADLLRAVNPSTGLGTSTIDLTFEHVLCRLDVDYSYYADLSYTELVEQTLLLPAVNACDLNLLTGALTYKASSTMTKWKGYSQDNARHLITTPYSFATGDSLGYIRFKRPAGDTATIGIKLVEDFSLIAGSKSTIKLSDRTTVGTSDWVFYKADMHTQGSLDACGTGSVTISPVITERRTVQDYVGTTAVGDPYTQTRTFHPSIVRVARYSGSTAFTVTNQNGTSTIRNTGENTTTAARSATFSISYSDPEGTMKTLSSRPTLTQPYATRTPVTGNAELSSISVSSATVTACGVVTPGSCTATYNTKVSIVTECGTVVNTVNSSSTKTVTANAPSIAENTSTSSKSVTVTVYYSEGGIEKSTTVSTTQPAATITGGATTWSSNAQACCSKYSFPYTLSTATLSYTCPTATTSAKVTACGTIVTPASSTVATVSWSVGAWSSSSSDTKASISGTTLTVPANTGVERTATITATFSNGTSKSFTITQAAGTHIVDAE